MRKSVFNKLHSRKGASLTFALLAFLVCAVVGAVLLASAQAASGRVSGLADMDRRYYAVTSAAQLFCDSLDGQTVSMERTQTKYSYASTCFDYTSDDGAWVETILPNTFPDGFRAKDDEYELRMKWHDQDEEMAYQAIDSDPTHTSLLVRAALFYVFGDTAFDDGTSDDYIEELLGPTFATGYTYHHSSADWDMSVEAEEVEDGSLNVDVKFKMKPDGRIEIKLTNHQANSDDPVDPYSIIITLLPSIQDNTTAPNVKKSDSYEIVPDETLTDPESEYAYYEVVTTTTVTTKETTITWTVSDVKKVMKNEET